MLNLDRQSRSESRYALDYENIDFQIDFEISTEVKIEKRIVTSLPSLFGEIGGLNDFFAAAILLFISVFQANLFLVDSIKRLFLVGKTSKRSSNAKQSFKDFSPTFCNRLKFHFIVLCNLCMTKKE